MGAIEDRLVKNPVVIEPVNLSHVIPAAFPTWLYWQELVFDKNGGEDEPSSTRYWFDGYAPVLGFASYEGSIYSCVLVSVCGAAPRWVRLYNCSLPVEPGDETGPVTLAMRMLLVHEEPRRESLHEPSRPAPARWDAEYAGRNFDPCWI